MPRQQGRYRNLPSSRICFRDSLLDHLQPLFVPESTMENPPLASLSLTHVHYVRIFSSAPDFLLTQTEPRGPHLVSMRMARPCAARAMRCLCHIDLVKP